MEFYLDSLPGYVVLTCVLGWFGWRVYCWIREVINR